MMCNCKKHGKHRNCSFYSRYDVDDVGGKKATEETEGWSYGSFKEGLGVGLKSNPLYSICIVGRHQNTMGLY